MKDRVVVDLNWQGAHRFAATIAGHSVDVDGDGERAPTPMEYLATGVAGCMAIDITDILAKMRTPAVGVRVSLEGERADQPPRRFTTLYLSVELEGEVPQGNLDRAIALSRDTYCSALSSCRADIQVHVTTRISRPSPPA